MKDTCYQCHPGNIIQCQRGAMKTGGMDCNACHGTDLLGTPLAKMPVARTFRIEDDETVNFAKNELVGCNRCHGMPDV